MPNNRQSEEDATYLKVFTAELAENFEAIQKATDGRFAFSVQSLAAIANRLEDKGYRNERPDGKGYLNRA